MRSGELLVDRYELGDRLGVGGMSTVVGAFDRRLERKVAVKLLAEHLADDRQFVSRFRREALAAARLVHPNIVQVFDFGLDERVPPPVHRDGARRRPVRAPRSSSDEGRMDLGDALSMVTQACAGLDYAHRNGVVHRDVKPGNLLRSGDGIVKLADFGIAKAMSDESAITQIGSVLGTAAYLAPEQAARRVGRPVGRHLRAGRRRLPADLRAPALRGELAHRARAQAAARDAPGPARDRPGRVARSSRPPWTRRWPSTRTTASRAPTTCAPPSRRAPAAPGWAGMTSRPRASPVRTPTRPA